MERLSLTTIVSLKLRSLIGFKMLHLMSFQVERRTEAVHTASPNPVWNQTFELDEIGGGEYLKLRCFSEETFRDEFIGSATVNLEGMVEGSVRDVWIPLEKVCSGELRLKIEAIRVEDQEGSRV